MNYYELLIRRSRRPATQNEPDATAGGQTIYSIGFD